MKRQDDRTDPSKPATSAEELVPRAPFDPPVRDPSVLAMLKGLNPSVTPVPVRVATTDDDLAASYAAGPRGIPHGEVTPAPEPSVVVRENTPESPRAKEPRAAKEPREELDTTFRLRGAPRSATLPLLAAALALGVAIAIGWSRGRSLPDASAAITTSPPPTIATQASPTRTEPSPAPSSPPTSPPAELAPPARTTSSSATPAAPSAKPSRGTAPRRKEDEPERVL